jgi:hypothetical protein
MLRKPVQICIIMKTFCEIYIYIYIYIYMHTHMQVEQLKLSLPPEVPIQEIWGGRKRGEGKPYGEDDCRDWADTRDRMRDFDVEGMQKGQASGMGLFFIRVNWEGKPKFETFCGRWLAGIEQIPGI